MSSFHFRDLIIQVNVLVQIPADEFSGKSSAFHHGQHVFDRCPDFFLGAFITTSFGVHPPVGALDGSLDDAFHIFFKIGFPLRGVFDAGGTGKPTPESTLMTIGTGVLVDLFTHRSRFIGPNWRRQYQEPCQPEVEHELESGTKIRFFAFQGFCFHLFDPLMNVEENQFWGSGQFSIGTIQ